MPYLYDANDGDSFEGPPDTPVLEEQDEQSGEEQQDVHFHSQS